MTEGNTAYIELKNLVRTYKKGNILIPAVNDVSCHIRKGSFFSIVGKSGSGKSTLLNLLGGLDKASSGDILFQGKNISQYNRKELADHRRERVGIIFQSFNLIHHRSAMSNVSLALAFGGVPPGKRNKRSLSLLEMVGLGDRADHFPNELSGGETQRVSIARALANEPKVLLADEPTGNLDSTTSQEIISLLEKLNKENGLTVIMVTHDQESAERVSDHMIRLKDGKITDEQKMQS